MKKLLALLLVLSLLSGLAAFGANDAASGPDSAGIAQSPVGGYRLTDIACGEDNNLSVISAVVSLGVSFCLVLEEDGTGCMDFLDAKIDLRWEDGCIILPSRASGEAGEELRIPFTCADGILKLSTYEYTMLFRQMTDAELADYRANGTGGLSGLLGMLAQNLLGGLDDDLVSTLLFSLALGADSYTEEPIPDGEPSVGTVTGLVDGLEFTIVGAEHILDDEAGDLIVIYYDVKNLAEELKAVWHEEVEAAQGGAFLEEVYTLDSVPELYNVNLEFVPGKTLRCASAYLFDSDGGTVGFRVRSYHGEGSVVFYADPQNLSGAPAVPYAFDDDPVIPAEYEALPGETENVIIEKVEFFMDEDGDRAVRLCYRAPDESEDGAYYFSTALQDGVSLQWIRDEEGLAAAEEDAGDGILWVDAYKLRTASPVVFVVSEEAGLGDETPVAARIVEVG